MLLTSKPATTLLSDIYWRVTGTISEIKKNKPRNGALRPGEGATKFKAKNQIFNTEAIVSKPFYYLGTIHLPTAIVWSFCV
jgi:hypothetical protein